MSGLQQKLSVKTDDQLLFYIDNIGKHTDEAVRLAYKELLDRGIELPENTSTRIAHELELKASQFRDQRKNHWTKNIVQDYDAPEYYSQRAIYVFSILFTVFFASFLLAENFKTAGKPKWPVLVFGFLYIGLNFVIAIFFRVGNAQTYIINAVGALIMCELFWKQYLGQDTKYRAKPVWKPAIIALIIFLPIMLTIIFNTRK